MHLVDTHCHIQSAGLTSGERSTRELWAKAPELSGEQLVADAAANEVTKMICVGCDIDDSALAVDFVSGRTDCWASVAVHPHEAAAVLAGGGPGQLRELVMNDKVVAIGECGLDYYYEHSPKQSQIEVLRFQLDLAVERNLPVIFHVRDAFDDFWPIFDSYRGAIRGVLHSFTDNKHNLAMAIERNLHIGVNGIATFVKDEAKLDVYRSIPAQNLLLETDAPFLTPVPFRGKINEPKQITTIASFMADLRNVTVEQLAAETTANAEHLFDI